VALLFEWLYGQNLLMSELTTLFTVIECLILLRHIDANGCFDKIWQFMLSLMHMHICVHMPASFVLLTRNYVDHRNLSMT